MPHLLRSIRSRLVFAAALIVPAIAGCITFRKVGTEELGRPSVPREIKTPVKAHLVDGSTVVYQGGVIIRDGALNGAGQRFDLALGITIANKPISLDSVAAMESYVSQTRWGPTLIASTLATTATVAVIGAIGLAASPLKTKSGCTGSSCGSCPTVYSDSAGVARLEAELFSLSIGPLFERRDMHVLRAQPSASGMVTLEVRNEMPETHYLNHLALLEVAHGADEAVVPDGRDQPLAYRGAVRPSSVRDREGRDVQSMLDGDDVFRSPLARLHNATSADLEDFIDIVVPSPAGGFPSDSVAIVFDLRSSPLSNVLLRDEMLAGQGALGVDWQGKDLQTMSYAIELGRWYGRRMGMHISVPAVGTVGEARAFDEVAYIADDGPVVWRRVAAVVPAPRRSGSSASMSDTLRVRLSFVADHWRIRSLRVAAAMRRPATRTVSLSSIVDARDQADSAALRNLRDSDTRYLITTPGQRFTARFDVGQGAGGSRTFLLAAQGYYTEWILASWLRTERAPARYVPGDSSLVLAMRHWGAQRGVENREFVPSFIPVR